MTLRMGNRFNSELQTELACQDMDPSLVSLITQSIKPDHHLCGTWRHAWPVHRASVSELSASAPTLFQSLNVIPLLNWCSWGLLACQPRRGTTTKNGCNDWATLWSILAYQVRKVKRVQLSPYSSLWQMEDRVMHYIWSLPVQCYGLC